MLLKIDCMVFFLILYFWVIFFVSVVVNGLYIGIYGEKIVIKIFFILFIILDLFELKFIYLFFLFLFLESIKFLFVIKLLKVIMYIIKVIGIFCINNIIFGKFILKGDIVFIRFLKFIM